MLPLITIGPFVLGTYGLICAAAFTTAGVFALHRLDALGLPRRRTLPAVMSAIAAGMFGAAVLWWVMAWVATRAGHPEVFPGHARTVLGAQVLGIPLAWLVFRLLGLPALRVLDQVIVALPLGQAIGRIGCLFAGCCAGRPTDSWLGLTLPDGLDHWRPRYPAQLIASAADLVLWLLLWRLDARHGTGAPGGARLRVGELTAVYLVLYGVKRFAMEMIRVNRAVVGPFTWAQLLAVGLVIAGASMWLLLRRRETCPA